MLLPQTLKRSLVTALLLGAVSVPALAADDLSVQERTPPRRLWLFFGLDGGIAKLSSGIPATELDKSGYGIHAKALLSYYWDSFLVDFGPGYSFNRLKGNSAFAPIGTEIPVRIYTDSAFIEVSPRFRLGNHWQLGLAANWYLGNDTSFSENAAELQKSTFFVGPRVNYETLGNDSRWRFGAQAITDLNLANRNIWLIQADIQYGFPICCRTEKEEKWLQSQPEPVVQEYAETTVTETAVTTDAMTVERVGNHILIQLPEAVLRFGTASAQLTDRGEAILQKVAEDLQRHPEAWSTLTVTGHTDQRGTNANNMRLSRARAASVARTLQSLGIPKSKIRSRGRGEEQLLDSANDANAWSRNRRVEIDVTATSESSSDLVDGLRSN